MPSQEIVYSPSSYRRAGDMVQDAATYIKNEIDRLFDRVLDFKVLGENDILGRIVNALYRLFIQVLREVLKSLVDGLLDQSETLKKVAKLYQETSDAAQALGALVGKETS